MNILIDLNKKKRKFYFINFDEFIQNKELYKKIKI
jgi:hypothetical protein